MYVPGKDFVPHFYPHKVGDENTSKTEPPSSSGNLTVVFFFYPWKALAKLKKRKKKKKKRRKSSAKNLLLGRILRICVFAFKLLLEMKECK